MNLFGKYNLEAIVSFMKAKFANLGTTYQLSNLSQIRVLLCSIFPSGLTWEYPGLSNTPISPIYQSIRRFESSSIGSCAESVSRTHIACSSDRCLDHLGYLGLRSKNYNKRQRKKGRGLMPQNRHSLKIVHVDKAF